MTLSEAVSQARYHLAANIRHHRISLGLTRIAFARTKDLNLRMLEAAEDPEGWTPALSSIVKVARALDVEVADLFARRELPAIKRGRQKTIRRIN